MFIKLTIIVATDVVPVPMAIFSAIESFWPSSLVGTTISHPGCTAFDEPRSTFSTAPLA